MCCDTTSSLACKAKEVVQDKCALSQLVLIVSTAFLLMTSVTFYGIRLAPFEWNIVR